MNSRPTVKLVSISLVSVAALALAAWMPVAQDGGKRGGGPPQQHEEEGGPLHDAMEQMNGSLRFLLKGVTAENKDKALEQVAKFQSAVITAKGLAPEGAAPADVAGYRKMLVQVLATSCRLETAVIDGKFDEANKIAKDELTKLKKEGHDKYAPDEDDHK